MTSGSDRPAAPSPSQPLPQPRHCLPAGSCVTPTHKNLFEKVLSNNPWPLMTPCLERPLNTPSQGGGAPVIPCPCQAGTPQGHRRYLRPQIIDRKTQENGPAPYAYVMPPPTSRPSRGLKKELAGTKPAPRVSESDKQPHHILSIKKAMVQPRIAVRLGSLGGG